MSIITCPCSKMYIIFCHAILTYLFYKENSFCSQNLILKVFVLVYVCNATKRYFMQFQPSESYKTNIKLFIMDGCYLPLLSTSFHYFWRADSFLFNSNNIMEHFQGDETHFSNSGLLSLKPAELSWLATRSIIIYQLSSLITAWFLSSIGYLHYCRPGQD